MALWKKTKQQARRSKPCYLLLHQGLLNRQRPNVRARHHHTTHRTHLEHQLPYLSITLLLKLPSDSRQPCKDHLLLHPRHIPYNDLHQAWLLIDLKAMGHLHMLTKAPGRSNSKYIIRHILVGQVLDLILALLLKDTPVQLDNRIRIPHKLQLKPLRATDTRLNHHITKQCQLQMESPPATTMVILAILVVSHLLATQVGVHASQNMITQTEAVLILQVYPHILHHLKA